MSDGPALLIVDDNDDNRYTLVRRLRREGYDDLTEAADGREALELMARRSFDLVLLDIMMPRLDGYQVLEQLHRDGRLSELPVIMISALNEIDSVVRCIALGAEDYLQKPFKPALLRARVGAALEKKTLRDRASATLKRLEQELGAARELQLSMVPQTFPEVTPARPIDVYALMEPAREVGGDLYDFFYAGDEFFCFLVGDVSDKGTPAALFMARTRSLIRLAVEQWRRATGEVPEIGQVMEAVNRELCQNNKARMFVTLFLAFLDTRSGSVRYANAGHVKPYRLSAAGALENVGEGAPDVPLGVRHGSTYAGARLALQPGDTLFIYSDGLTDATNEDDSFYAVARLETSLRQALPACSERLVRDVKARLDDFVGAAPRFDDVAILAVRWRPADA